MSEKPEVQLTLGCCTVLVIGGLCHWLLIHTVWVNFVDSRYVDWETVFAAVILFAVSAFIFVPVSGFAGLTLLRMAWRCLPSSGDDQESNNSTSMVHDQDPTN